MQQQAGPVEPNAAPGVPVDAADRARESVLEQYQLLGSRPPQALSALVDLAAQAAGVPYAAINLITTTEQHQVAAHGFQPAVCSREDSMCAAVLHDPDPVLVPDARVDRRFRDNPFVTGEIGTVRFYSAHQLVTPDDIAIGTLCVFDDDPRELDDGQASALAVLAGRIVDVLELDRVTRSRDLALRRLARTQETLGRSNRQLADFATRVSHDLRTPLSSIQMSLDLALETVDDLDEPDLLEHLARARRGAARLVDLVSDVLRNASLDAVLRPTTVGLGSLLEDVMEDLGAWLEDAEVHLGAGLPDLWGDPTLVRSVLQNLVANAVKFARAARRRPLVRVEAVDVGAAWRVVVSDNGPGVPAAVRESVFVRGDRGESTSEGLGIGLAACRQVVASHGGTMAIAEGPDGGAAVWFELPKAPIVPDQPGGGDVFSPLGAEAG